MEKKDVFISYKTEEFDEAEWVRSTLENNGISCWMAPACIPGGSSYAVEIPQAIRNCKVFVLILSEKSQLSKWVPRELDQAINEGKTVLPFMLEDCALKDDFNFYLTNVQRYAAYESKTAAFEKMLREIKALLNINIPNINDENQEITDSVDSALSDDANKSALKAEKKTMSSKPELNPEPQKKEKKKKAPKEKKKVKNKSNNGKKKLFIGVGVAASLVLVVLIAVISSVLNTVVIAGEKYKKDDDSVYISGCEITQQDIDAILKMEDLHTLSIEDCTLPSNDISWVTCADRYLVLKNCGITNEHINSIDFSTLVISNLNIDENPLLSDLSAVAQLSDTLTTLSFNGCSVKDISFVGSLEKLISLYADKNGIKDISAMAKCTDLQIISLNGNYISSLQTLSECADITHIYVNSNQLTSLNGLEKAISLTTLEAEYNSISNLNGICNATVLEKVVLNNNAFSLFSISDPMKILVKSALTLKELYLNNNNFSDISALAACTKLHTLSIDYCYYIDSLDFLKNCTELSYLSASGCNIKSMQGIQNCTNLSYLDLSDNAIDSTDLLPSLEQNDLGVHLNLSANKITSIDLPKIKYVYLALHGNPISSLDLTGTTGYEVVIEYSDGYDYAAFKEAGYTKYFVINCPLDKQLSVSDALGASYVSFMSEQEYESYSRSNDD